MRSFEVWCSVIVWVRLPLTESLRHVLLAPALRLLGDGRRQALQIGAVVGQRRRQAITGRLLLLAVGLHPPLSRDGVEQRHGNSLSPLLEGCYQVLDVPEIPLRHTGSRLKTEDSGGWGG